MYFVVPNIFFSWPTGLAAKAASDNQLDVEIANAGNDSPKASRGAGGQYPTRVSQKWGLNHELLGD